MSPSPLRFFGHKQPKRPAEAGKPASRRHRRTHLPKSHPAWCGPARSTATPLMEGMGALHKPDTTAEELNRPDTIT
ncbi:hypothetical protein GCM10023223_09280 [Stackebrandtia albiflava]